MAETDNTFENADDDQNRESMPEGGAASDDEQKAPDEFDFSALGLGEDEETPVNPLEAVNYPEDAGEASPPSQPEASETPQQEQTPEGFPSEAIGDDMPSTPDFSGMALDSAKEALASAGLGDDRLDSHSTGFEKEPQPTPDDEDAGPPPVDLSQWTGSIETSGKAGNSPADATEPPMEADEAPPAPPQDEAEEPQPAPPPQQEMQPDDFDDDEEEPGLSPGPDAGAALHADNEETPPGLYDQISSSKFNEELQRSPQLSEQIAASTAVAASRRTVGHAELKGKADDLFRGMWASVFYSGQMTGNAAIICSPSRHEGATTIACGLAIAGSGPAGGARVCLVDFNLRAPAVHEVFGLRQTPGLTDVLAGDQELHTVINGINDSLDVITVGNMSAHTLDVLRSEAVENFFDILSDTYDYILVDAPAANHYPDAQVLAAVVGDVVLVTHADQTPREAVAQAKKRIESGGGKVAGLVLNQRSFPIPSFLYRRV
jgi:capsular exopolysaccharide synthesis family protein